MKFEFSWSIFQEYSNTKFHDEADSRPSQFRERAKKMGHCKYIRMTTEA